MADDQFSGKSPLNLVAAVCILTALIGPIVMGRLLPHGIPKMEAEKVIL